MRFASGSENSAGKRSEQTSRPKSGMISVSCTVFFSM
jgi:hypothetical protein